MNSPKTSKSKTLRMTAHPESDQRNLTSMSAHGESGVQKTTCSESLDTPKPNGSIGRLPPEIISHIFVVGSLDRDEEDAEDVEALSLDDDPVHFATLCSHVCQYWRHVAIDTPQLWTCLDFEEGPPFDKSKEWIARSKAAPLTIQINHTAPEDANLQDDERGARIIKEAGKAPGIFALILPQTHRWRSFEVISDYYELIWLWQKQFVDIGPTLNLEYLGLFCHEEWIADDIFHPQELRSPISIFSAGALKLKSVSLWGVHVDWETVSFLEGLKSFQLAWHTKDVRPSCERFAHVLKQSPDLETLTLEGSAPLPGSWPQERIPLNSLHELVITCIDVEEALAIIDHIGFPALRNLTLDLEDTNMKPFISTVCKGQHPRFRDVESLKLTSFECSPKAGKQFLSSMPNLTSMTLNFNFLPLHFRHTLASPPLLCPKLNTLKLSGLDDKALKGLIRARKKGATPIQRLYLDEDDELTDGTVRWLKEQVETVKFYEASDDEDEEGEDDEEDDDDE